jgi:predicted  nucleic acid-binding Zn-ribbon protein
MTHQQPASTPPANPILQAIGSFFRFVITLVFVLIVGTLVGVGIYYGVPWVYHSLVQPVQQNTARVTALEQRMIQEQARLQDENLTLQERIAVLETEMTTLREQSAVQAQEIEESAEQIQQLEPRITQVEQDLAAQQQVVEAFYTELHDAVTDAGAQSDQITEQTKDFEGRLALLQTAQDLLRVRILLIEGDTGSARDTIALAWGHLEQAMTLMPEQAETLLELQRRVVGLNRLIEERSFRVLPELESLWADTIDLILPAILPPAEVLAPVVPVEGTPTPTPRP